MGLKCLSCINDALQTVLMWEASRSLSNITPRLRAVRVGVRVSVRVGGRLSVGVKVSVRES